MATVTRWNPVREMVTLRDAMDQLFNDRYFRERDIRPNSQTWQLPIDAFTTEDQLRLSVHCHRASTRGARVILSNANTEVTQELYADQTIDFLEVSRSIAAKTIDRKMAKELLVTF